MDFEQAGHPDSDGQTKRTIGISEKEGIASIKHGNSL
jgi:hypothetical protein